MIKPSPELEKEIMEYTFSKQCKDHNAALKVWKSNPWLAVSMYERAVFPEMQQFQLAVPDRIYTPEYEAIKLDEDIQKFLDGDHEIPLVSEPRAEEGEYELEDGKIAVVNRFGRIINPEDLFDDF